MESKALNRSLSAAKAAKQDEFYTQYVDWAAAGFVDTFVKVFNGTGGGSWSREGGSVRNSSLRRFSW